MCIHRAYHKMNTKYIVAYIGSFDPFHKGHLEAIQITLRLYHESCIDIESVVILPNNPSKSKPNRSPLFYRSYLMGYLFPIYADQSWITDKNKTPKSKIIVDTTHVDTALNKLKRSNYKIIGIIGSDIVNSKKQPKWTPDRWIIFERAEELFEDNFLTQSTFFEIPFDVVRLDKTKYQHISSTMVRNDENLRLLHLPKSLATVYIKKNFGSYHALNSTVLSYTCDSSYFIKEMVNDKSVENYCQKSKLWNKYNGGIFTSSKVEKVEGTKIYETLLESYETLWDIMVKDIDNTNEKLDDIFKMVFIKLDELHNSMKNNIIIHKDVTVTNIMVKIEDDEIDIALIDYDKVRYGTRKYQLREYYQLLSSIEYYAVRCGLKMDFGKWKNIGNKYYQFQFQFDEQSNQHWINYWWKIKNIAVYDEFDFVDEF